jgi:hypothetical protein
MNEIRGINKEKIDKISSDLDLLENFYKKSI